MEGTNQVTDVVVVVVTGLGGQVWSFPELPVHFTAFDVSTRIEEQGGPPARLSRLVHGVQILPRTALLAELPDRPVKLTLVVSRQLFAARCRAEPLGSLPSTGELFSGCSFTVEVLVQP